METRKSWGTVVVAGVFAVLAIAVAAGTYLFEDGKHAGLEVGGPNDADRDGLTTAEELAWGTDPAKADTDGDGVIDGAEVQAGASPTIANTSVNPFETRDGQTPGNIIAAGIAKTQMSLETGASDGEVKAAISSLANEVGFPKLDENIAVTDLRVTEGMSMSLYAQIVYEILRESTTVRESELALFRKTIAAQNYSGTPALKDAARTYKEIEAALIAMQVPPAVAVEHAQLVNAVGTLANIVGAMGSWSGDPFAGIAYVEAFTANEPRIETSIGVLIEKISKNLNKS